MSETAVPTKTKRRRRLATPPPSEDNLAPVVDFYDRCVSKTFKDLKSGIIELVKEPSMTDRPHSQGSLVSLEDQVIIDLDPDSDREVVETPEPAVESISVPEIPIVECVPASPPPPVYKPNRRRRLDNDVKAALHKLERVRTDLENSAEEEYRLNQAHQVMSTLTPLTLVGETRTKLKVRICMPSGIVRYDINVLDPLYNLREEIAKRESTSAERISLFFDDTFVTNSDTVKSLGLTVADTVEAYVLVEGQGSSTSQTEEDDQGLLNIKIQGKHGQRDVMNLQLARGERLDALMRKFAASKKLDLSKLTFQFDGDEISGEMTPSSLDMEDGDCVDVAGY